MIKRKYEILKGSLEEVTKKRIKEYFNDNNIWYKMVQPSHIGSSVGMSDFQCLHKGLFIAIEAKRNLPSAKPTPHQIEYLKMVNANGGFGMVVKCTEDILKLDEELKKRGVVE
jgi:penicillin-binding protein-related factor A (putative recombinase)